MHLAVCLVGTFAWDGEGKRGLFIRNALFHLSEVVGADLRLSLLAPRSARLYAGKGRHPQCQLLRITWLLAGGDGGCRCRVWGELMSRLLVLAGVGTAQSRDNRSLGNFGGIFRDSARCGPRTPPSARQPACTLFHVQQCRPGASNGTNLQQEYTIPQPRKHHYASSIAHVWRKPQHA